MYGRQVGVGVVLAVGRMTSAVVSNAWLMWRLLQLQIMCRWRMGEGAMDYHEKSRRPAHAYDAHKS
jgi:hypothetical protein